MADIHDKEESDAGHAAVNHWHGHSHKITSVPSPIEGTTMYRVTPKEKS